MSDDKPPKRFYLDVRFTQVGIAIPRPPELTEEEWKSFGSEIVNAVHSHIAALFKKPDQKKPFYN
jgi:hypothetical protein